MILQLNPPVPLNTVKGDGWAHFLIDYGPESALLWVVFMDSDGACWTVPNSEVRMCVNWTMGRRKPEDIPSSSRDTRAAVHRSFGTPGPRAMGDGAPTPLRPAAGSRDA